MSAPTLALAALTAAVVAVAITVVGGPTAASSTTERTVTASQGVIESTVSGTGSLTPVRQADVDFKTSGQVAAVYVKEGEHVHDGEVLARLDPRSADVALAGAKADLQTAQDNLDAAEKAEATTASASTTTTIATGATSKDSKSKATKGTGTQTTTAPSAGSGSASTSSTMSVTSAKAALDSAELALDTAEDDVSDTYLKAPMAGTVASVDGAVGDQAGSSSSGASASDSAGTGAAASGSASSGTASTGTSGSTSSSSGFITLAQMTTYKMEVSLSESDIGSVKKGQSATVTVNAASGQEFAAHVSSIAVLSSSSSSTTSGTSAVSYPVELTLDQSSSKLKPGMSASADIVTARATGVTVPTQALSGSTVTVDAGGKHETRQVQTGVAGDSSTQITSGLAAGDRVVVRSQSARAGAAATGSQSGTQRTGIGQAAGGFGAGGGLGRRSGGFPAGAGGGGFPGAGGGP